MSIIIGADLVPTKSNISLFKSGDGDPELIEANSIKGSIWLIQMDYGTETFG